MVNAVDTMEIGIKFNEVNISHAYTYRDGLPRMHFTHVCHWNLPQSSRWIMTINRRSTVLFQVSIRVMLFPVLVANREQGLTWWDSTWHKHYQQRSSVEPRCLKDSLASWQWNAGETRETLQCVCVCVCVFDNNNCKWLMQFNQCSNCFTKPWDPCSLVQWCVYVFMHMWHKWGNDQWSREMVWLNNYSILHVYSSNT